MWFWSWGVSRGSRSHFAIAWSQPSLSLCASHQSRYLSSCVCASGAGAWSIFVGPFLVFGSYLPGGSPAVSCCRPSWYPGPVWCSIVAC
uniref:Uncharacterized protein n=1 Tax=Amphimedon queenslandica TaxID=400682 RepID=A0A1X7VER7_AMPQE